jgi:hypothetical protein
VSRATKPRAADVARWVATLAEPEPAGQGREAWREYRKNRDNAAGMLASWGLGSDGLPLVKAVAS